MRVCLYMSIRSQGHSLKKCFVFFFTETVGSFKTKFHIKAYGNAGMNIYTNELGHMTKMAAMPICD